MTSEIRPQPGIMDIALYEGGAATIAGQTNTVKLSSNENPFGPSDKAKDAFSRSVHLLHRYPSTDHAALRTAIADTHGLDGDRVICGVGSDEIIHFLCQAYAGPGDEVLFTEHGFLMYRISAMAAGATPVEVTERDRTTDVAALLAACTPRTKLVFIANPNNPTGTMISASEIAQLAEGLPPQAILVPPTSTPILTGSVMVGVVMKTSPRSIVPQARADARREVGKGNRSVERTVMVKPNHSSAGPSRMAMASSSCTSGTYNPTSPR